MHIPQKHEHIQSLGIRERREGNHGWLAFLTITVTSSPGFPLVDKREGN